MSEWPPAEPTLLCLQTSNYFFSFSVLVFVNITRPTNFNILFFFFCISLCQHCSLPTNLIHQILFFRCCLFVFLSSYLDWSLSTLLWLQTWFTKFFSSYHRVLCCSHIMSGAGGVEGQEPPNLGHTHEKHIRRLSQNKNPEQKSILNIYISPGKTYAHSFSTVDKWYQWSIAFLISIYQQLWSLNRNNKITTCFCLTSNTMPSLITNQHCFDQMLLLRRVTKLQLINHKSEKLTKHGELDQRHRWWSIE